MQLPHFKKNCRNISVRNTFLFYNINVQINAVFYNKYRGGVCMKDIKMELLGLIEKIDDEKLLNKMRFVILGYLSNEKK